MFKRKEKGVGTEDTKAQIQIVVHKNASKKQVKQVKEANKHLNELFDDNHFTVKLVLASKG